MSLQTYRRRDQALQLAFVATVVSIVIEIVLSIILGLLRPDIFSVSGESLLLQNATNGTWNTPLITGLIILAVFILGVTASPLLRPNANDLHPARAVIYVLTAITFIYLGLVYIAVPVWNGHILALQSAYWPISIGLAASIGFIVVSQPQIADREPKTRQTQKRKTKNKKSAETVDNTAGTR